MLKPSGHRLDEKHNQIIRKFAKKWNLKEAEALRKLIYLFSEYEKLILTYEHESLGK